MRPGFPSTEQKKERKEKQKFIKIGSTYSEYD
jgi:hypothetical protein